MSKKAILAVSFGTSHWDTLEKNIAAIERDLAAAFPDKEAFAAAVAAGVAEDEAAKEEAERE